MIMQLMLKPQSWLRKSQLKKRNTKAAAYITVIYMTMALRALTICPTVFDLISRRSRHFPCNWSAINKPSPARMTQVITKLAKHNFKNIPERDGNGDICSKRHRIVRLTVNDTPTHLQIRTYNTTRNITNTNRHTKPVILNAEIMEYN